MDYILMCLIERNKNENETKFGALMALSFNRRLVYTFYSHYILRIYRWLLCNTTTMRCTVIFHSELAHQRCQIGDTHTSEHSHSPKRLAHMYTTVCISSLLGKHAASIPNLASMMPICVKFVLRLVWSWPPMGGRLIWEGITLKLIIRCPL